MRVELDLTVIICSHRSNLILLDQVIDQILEGKGGLKLEILLVSNGGQLIEDAAFRDRYEAKQSCKVIFSDARSILAARRCGVNHAKAETIAFIDDDNLVVNTYLPRAQRELEQNPNLVAIGARVVPTEAAEIRFQEVFGRHFSKVLGFYAISEGRSRSVDGDSYQFVSTIFGAGMCFRRSAITEILAEALYCEGRSGLNLSSGDDTEICFRALSIGKIGRLNMVGLEHEICVERIDEKYLARLGGSMLVTLPVLHRLFWRRKWPSWVAACLTFVSSLYVAMRVARISGCSLRPYFDGWRRLGSFTEK